MNQIKSNTPNTPSLATRFAALAAKAAPWRRFAGPATLAIILGGIVSTAQAALLVYEPFNYSSTWVTSLNGQNGGTGFDIASAWVAANSNVYPSNSPSGFAICDSTFKTLWNGTLVSVPQSGKFAGSPAPVLAGGSLNGNNPDHMWASRTLAPSVTATFTNGAVTWMCFAQASNFKANANGLGCSLAIGAGVFPDDDTNAGRRGGATTNGPAIGIGLFPTTTSYGTAHRFTAAFWTTVSGEYYLINGPIGYYFDNRNTNPIICLAKIVWGDASNPTTVYQTAFLDGTPLTEDVFNNSTNLVSNSGIVDPTTFTNLLEGGARVNIDEIRIGTTFDDVIGIVPGSLGTYWAPTSRGGSGIWASGTNNWASIPNLVGGLPQSTTNTLIFAGTNSTVTVNGTATVGAGLQFSVNGYRLVPGISTPQISLTGANAAANTITVVTGTNTIAVPVIGANGMTKADVGTLVLSGVNTYSGGTVLSLGTLQITDANSLGSGNVDFEGGTLQYPPGTGASALDVSGKIATVASGQVAAIDTDGYDVTFGTAIGGAGGLTKLGGGSLTLAVANTYAGPTTVSGGTLNVSSASGVIATLNVPAGGTVNLGAGAVVTALNVTGGTVNLTGAGVQVGTLFTSGGTLNAFSNPLTVTNSAGLSGITLTLGGASSFTLSGTNLAGPTPLAHTIVTAAGGTLTFVVTGLDAAIGIGAPGAPAQATAIFSGNGVWDLVGGIASDINSTYGKDNHAFHYIQVPTGDFDIKVHVTGATNTLAGLMARDNLVSEWDSHTGNYIGIWTGLGNSVQGGYATIQSAASHASPPWVNSVGISQGAVTPWLEIQRTGFLLTTSCSSDGSDGSYVQVQQQDYSSSPWGPTMYLGLDLINTATAGAIGGAYDNVNFMGTAGSANMSTTEFALNGGAQLNLGPTVTVAKVSTNGTALADGCWAGSAITGASHIAPTIFTSTGPGIAVISAAGPLTLTTPDITVTASDPYSPVVVDYPPLVVAGGTAPYTVTNYVPPSGSSFLLGTNVVTVTVTDSSCPAVHTTYSSFRIIVAPSAPVLDPRTGFSIQGGNPTFTFTTFTSMYYRLVYTNNVTTPAAAWLPVVNLTGNPPTDANGWVFANGTSMTLTDPDGMSASRRFYRIEVSPTGQ